MNILALDSSGGVASLAVMCDGRIIGEYSIDHKLTHSQTLMPMLDELKSRIEYEPAKTDIIAVAAGPGSFTGLRIGAAAAKGMAFALGCDIMPVPTLEGLAYRFWGYKGIICPLMDARRAQIYSGVYTFEKDVFKTLYEGEALALEEQLKRLADIEGNVMFLGDGVDVHADRLKESLKDRCIIAPAHLCYQSAAAVAVRAEEMLAQGIKATPSEDFAPEYLRRSQAEREREERLAAES